PQVGPKQQPRARVLQCLHESLLDGNAPLGSNVVGVREVLHVRPPGTAVGEQVRPRKAQFRSSEPACVLVGGQELRLVPDQGWAVPYTRRTRCLRETGESRFVGVVPIERPRAEIVASFQGSIGSNQLRGIPAKVFDGSLPRRKGTFQPYRRR